MNEYKTQNLYEASFLACRGFQFTGKEYNNTKATLVYTNSQELQHTVIEFYSGGKVSAKELFDWYRTIKDFIFSNR